MKIGQKFKNFIFFEILCKVTLPAIDFEVGKATGIGDTQGRKTWHFFENHFLFFLIIRAVLIDSVLS